MQHDTGAQDERRQKNSTPKGVADSIPVWCEHTKVVPIESLCEHPQNPNQHPAEQLERLAEIIKGNGWRWPIKVSRRSGLIVSGNGRFLCARDYLRVKEVPIDVQYYPDEAAELNDLLADNHLAELAEVDEKGVEEVRSKIRSLGAPDLSGYGASSIKKVEDKTAELLKSANDVPRAEPPSAADVRSQPGDEWFLGDHRLLCGDSTSGTAVRRLVGGERAELLFTSPPYSDIRDYNGGKELSPSHLSEFVPAYREYCDYFVVNLGLQNVDGGVNPYWDYYISAAKAANLKLLAWNVWDKLMVGQVGNQMKMFPTRHEWLLVFGPKAKDLNPTWNKRPENVVKQVSATLRRQKDGSTKVSTQGDCSNTLKKMESVVQMHPELGEIRHKHPATFPVGLPLEFIMAMTEEGDIVCEPFSGSGTTIMACESSGRRCRAMEIDPAYVDVAVKRYVAYKGPEKVSLIRDGKKLTYGEVFT